MKNQNVEIYVNNLLSELNQFIDMKTDQNVEVTTIHAYVCSYEAENDTEVDVYYVNVKACHSFAEQETFCDNMIFENLEDCQNHIFYIENKLIENGYEDLLLVDKEVLH